MREKPLSSYHKVDPSFDWHMPFLQAPELSRQVRALHALQALTKSKAGSDNVQNAFREAGGIRCLVGIMNSSPSRTEEGTEEHVAKCKAVEGFFFLCRNNSESRCSPGHSGCWCY